MDKELLDKLCKPFPVDVIEWRPQQLSRDRTSALALAYVDLREYEQRADEVIGPENWTVDVQFYPIEDRVVFVTKLTVMDIVRWQVGESLYVLGDRVNENAATSAYAQAVKRAWASLGLGRYLYQIPGTFADYDHKTRSFTESGLRKLRKGYEVFLRGGEKVAPVDEVLDRLKACGVSDMLSAVEVVIGKQLAEMSKQELRLVYLFAGVAKRDKNKALEILAVAVDKGLDWKKAVALYEEE